MERLNNFLSFKNHPMLKKSFSKLKQDELNICLKFLNETALDDKNKYAHKVVRLFLDKAKPKNWKEIEELLICAK